MRLADLEGAVWTRALTMKRVEMGTVAGNCPGSRQGGPAASGGTCGIVVCGLAGTGLPMCSRLQRRGMGPEGWARKVADSAGHGGEHR